MRKRKRGGERYGTQVDRKRKIRDFLLLSIIFFVCRRMVSLPRGRGNGGRELDRKIGLTFSVPTEGTRPLRRGSRKTYASSTRR